MAESQSYSHLLVKSTTNRDAPKLLLGETGQTDQRQTSLLVCNYVLLALRRGQSKREAAIKVGISSEDLKYRAWCLSVITAQKSSLLNLSEEGRAVAQCFCVWIE